MSPQDPDDAHVNFTVKELLAGIKKDQAEGFARLEVGIAGKADKADVARMETRLDAHAKALDEHRLHIAELQVEAREEKRARAAAETTNEWWHSRIAKIGGFVVGCALVAAAVFPIVQAIS